MRKNLIAMLVIATLPLAACIDSDHERGGEHAAVDTNAIANSLKAQEAGWNRLYAARDAAGLAAIYAHDAALANPGAPLVTGSAIRPAIDQFVTDPNLQVQFASDRVQVAASGDLAYTRGHFTMRSTDPATRQPRTDSGNYLTVWQRQSDNSWKAVEDFITPGSGGSRGARARSPGARAAGRGPRTDAGTGEQQRGADALSKPALALAAALAASAWGAALANDSTAEMAAGGLVLTRSADIEMRSEDLYISRQRVRVRYVFYNRSARPITTRVAFPLPDLDLQLAREQDTSFPADFRTAVDGRPVRMEVERRAILNGVDRTALLTQLGVPPDEPRSDNGPVLQGLSAEVARRLEREGLAEVEWESSGPIVSPLWHVRETWHWTQTFPARRPITIEHSYVPGVGGTAGVPLAFRDYRDSEDGRREAARYCADRAFMAALDRMQGRTGESNFMIEHRIGYVLSTGANWAAPIGDFRLVVDKGEPGAIVSFCGTGLRRISPTQFEMRRRNWRPTADLAILIVRRMNEAGE